MAVQAFRLPGLVRLDAFRDQDPGDTSMTTASKTPTYPTSDYSGAAAAAASQAGEAAERAAQSVRETTERLGEHASAAGEQIKAGFDQATEALGAGIDDLKALQQEWLASVRGYVQEHPLVSVAAAIAAGVIIARLIPREGGSQHRHHMSS